MSDHKQLVEDFIQALFTRGDLGAADTYLSPDFVDHDPTLPGSGSGPGAMREAAGYFRRALPDWRSDVEQLIAEGDLVVERFTARGTHSGELMGVAPTGRELILQGINIFRVSDGRIIERWGRLDQLGFFRQLGLVPAAPAEAAAGQSIRQ
jgi:steroid delta-isomerase-like uncharacterized protein